MLYPVHHLSGTTYSFIDISIVPDHVANANPVTSANDPGVGDSFTPPSGGFFGI